MGNESNSQLILSKSEVYSSGQGFSRLGVTNSVQLLEINDGNAWSLFVAPVPRIISSHLCHFCAGICDSQVISSETQASVLGGKFQRIRQRRGRLLSLTLIDAAQQILIASSMCLIEDPPLTTLEGAENSWKS
jgi:hypothetical protein